MQVLRSSVAVVLVVVATSACSRESKEGAKPAPSTSATDFVAPSPPTASAARAQPKVPLVVVARGDGPSGLLDGGGTTLAFAARLLFRLDATGIHQEPELVRGLARGGLRFALHGGFTDGLLDVEGELDESTGAYPHKLYKRANDKWIDAPASAVRGDVLVATFPWKDGRRVGVVRFAHAKDFRFELLAGKVPVQLPSPGAAAPPDDAGEGADPDAACKTKILPNAALGFASGQVFVAGAECTQSGEGPEKLERWDGEARKGTIDALEPDRGKGVWSLAGASPTDVWALRRDDATSPRLVRFDGSAWKTVLLPDGAIATSDVVVDASGAPWLGLGERLVRRAGEAWEEVALPPIQGGKLSVRQVSMGASGAFVLVDVGRSFVILGPGAAADVTQLPTLIDTEPTPLGPGTTGFEIATAACSTIVVPLQANVTEKQKFPAVAAALADAKGLEGMELVIDDWGGGKMLEAKAPSLAVARTITERMKEKSPATIAKPLCHVPNVKATVSLAP